jgi:hypothetical protein
VNWLDDGHLPVETDRHLALTDDEVTAAILAAARNARAHGHDVARRIVERDQFRVAYLRKGEDVGERRIGEKFGEQNARYGASPKRPEPPECPVLERDGTVWSSLSLGSAYPSGPATARRGQLVG